MSNWIKCIERMPPKEEMVIACTKDKSMYIAFYNPRGGCFDDGDFFSDIRDVTHWQPLPAAPDGQ